jgi:hypothetical protein
MRAEEGRDFRMLARPKSVQKLVREGAFLLEEDELPISRFKTLKIGAPRVASAKL